MADGFELEDDELSLFIGACMRVLEEDQRHQTSGDRDVVMEEEEEEEEEDGDDEMLQLEKPTRSRFYNKPNHRAKGSSSDEESLES